MANRPDPSRVPAIEACLSDLRGLVKALRKEGATGPKVGKITDNISALELVLTYGSFDGKVPWPVTEPTLTVFKSHGLEDLIHDEPTLRHRRDL